MSHALSPRLRHIALVTAHTAQGDQEQLDRAIRDALDDGLTISDLKEVFIHAYTYLGFPRAIWGSYIALAAIEARTTAGVVDEAGREPSPIEASSLEEKRALGQRLMEQVTGHLPQPDEGGVLGFNYGLVPLLQDHLFADVFARDVLSIKEHELITVVALLCNPPMETISTESHLKIAQHVGITRPELEELLDLIDERVDTEIASVGRQLL